MTKEKTIKCIQTIIKEFGNFSAEDANADSSPCVATLGGDSYQLLENFYPHKAEAVTYVQEIETSTEYLLYEELSAEILTKILVLAKDYAAKNM